MESAQIRSAIGDDVAAIARVYNHYILHSVATFEVDAVSVEEMANRIELIRSQGFDWLVADQSGEVVGYAYSGKWAARCAYKHSAESSVYLSPGHVGQGVGSRLYERLLEGLSDKGMHTAIGGIALPNEGSVALHEKFGFEKAAHYREVGFKFGRWIDVGYWQRLL